MASITKETLEHLAELARIELDSKEEGKMLRDLSKILDYFEELKEVDTSAVEPMTGGTILKNAFREDADGEQMNRGAGTDAFPEKENGFLKIPPVFE